MTPEERRALVLAYAVTHTQSTLDAMYALHAQGDSLAFLAAAWVREDLDSYIERYAEARDRTLTNRDEYALMVTDARSFVTEHRDELDELLTVQW